MFTINADDYKLGTLHVGGDGNIYRVVEGQGDDKTMWQLEETRVLTDTIATVMADKKMTVTEKINALTELPEGVGCNFFGSCQYYSAWQVYYLCHLAERYPALKLAELGFDCDLGDVPDGGLAAKLQQFREDDMKIMFDGSEEQNVRVCIDNRWMIWFGVGCPDEAHPLELCKQDDNAVVWLPTNLDELSKEDCKRVRKFQKRKFRRLIDWLENVKTEEVITDVGEFEVLRATISKKVIKVIKRRIRWKCPMLPYYPRSKKDDKKLYKALAKAAKKLNKGTKKCKKEGERLRKKAHEKYGLGPKQIAWDKLKVPEVTDPMRSYTSFYIPIEAAPTATAKLQLKRVAKQKAKWQAELDAITTPRDWICWLMKHSDMWTGIPKVFQALYPNATIKAPDAKSPGGWLLNDWSANYSIGLQCYILRNGGHVESDADFECSNS